MLQSPEIEVHCTELMGSGAGMDETSYVIDEQTRQAYRLHIRDLEEGIAEAEEQNDLVANASSLFLFDFSISQRDNYSEPERYPNSQ